MSGTFANRLEKDFTAEIEEASRHAQAHGYGDSMGPYVASYYVGPTGGHAWDATDGFRSMVNNSHLARKFKWTLNTRGDLAVVNPMLKHAAASGGGDVWTAGHGWKSGLTSSDQTEITLDNDTGHYWTTEPSLQRAVAAWQFLGYTVKTQAFKDPKAALAKLAF